MPGRFRRARKSQGALTGLDVRGTVRHGKMNLGKGHQAVQETVYATAKQEGGKLTFVERAPLPGRKGQPS